MEPVEQLARVHATWRFYENGGERVVLDEIAHAIGNPYQRAPLVAEVRARIKKAEGARLVPWEDVRPIRRTLRVQNMYHLPFRTGGDGYVPARLWRLYFVWQPSVGPIFWALRFAEKRRGRLATVFQDQDIQLAWRRFEAWPR